MRIHRINPTLREWDRISAEAAKQLAAHKERRYIRNLVIWWLVVGLTLAGLALWAQPAKAVEPWQLVESRYCGEPKRDASGDIYRSSAVRSAFQKIHPCPSTGLSKGACPGWQRDHVIPLVSGGCDAVANLQWLPTAIKTCAGTVCKDRWEQKVYDYAPVRVTLP